MASSKLPRSNFSSNKSDHHDFTIGTGPRSHPVKTSEKGAPVETGRGIQSVLSQIQIPFAPRRRIERRHYMKTDGGMKNRGRRKDDIKEPRPRPQLAQLAQPIILQIQATSASATQSHRRHDTGVWDIGDAPEVSDGEIPKLLESCEEALGFKKPTSVGSLKRAR
jgi:hypothetical protein